MIYNILTTKSQINEVTTKASKYVRDLDLISKSLAH